MCFAGASRSPVELPKCSRVVEVFFSASLIGQAIGTNGSPLGLS